MIWLILTQLLVLSFLSYKKDRLQSLSALRSAWAWFAWVFFINPGFVLIRLGNSNSSSIALVEIWANGAMWLCLGMSVYQLPKVFLGEELIKPLYKED